jgi:toxin ParE1/3/4
MRCIFSDRSEKDLEDIGDFIAQDSPQRALSYTQELRAYCRKIAQTPKIRRVVAHLGGQLLRKALFGNYQIYYALLDDGDGVEIVHIRHGARQDPEFMK